MKLGAAEGTPEEIKNFLENQGWQANKFFHEAEKPIGWHWFAVAAVCVLASIAFLVFYEFKDHRGQTFTFLMGCGGALWLATNIQIRFKNIFAAAGVLIGCILFLLVAWGIVLPSELPDHARKWSGKT